VPAIGRVLAEWAIDGQSTAVVPRPFRAGRFAEGRPLVGAHEDGDRDYNAARARRIMVG
jgi:hypothetical protein